MRSLSLAALLAISGLVGLGCNNNHLTQAAATPSPTQPIEDAFTQTSSNGKSDILFVINNTDNTMVAKATTLGTSATAFMNYLTTNQVDFHIAVTSMDMLTGDSNCSQSIGSGGCFGGSPHVIDSSTPNLLATFQANLQVGFNGDGTELGIDAGLAAVSAPLATGGNAGFLRSDAKLFVVFITDEDDNATVPGGNIFASFNPGDYIAAYAASKGGNTNNVIFSAIAGDVPNGCGGGSSNGVGGDPGSEYAALISASNGLFESVCDAEYSTFLSNLGYTVATPQATFPLSQVPSDPSTIQVTVNGTPSTNWTYDSPTNSITFTPGNIPPAGATVVIDYDVYT